jgi:hypothetical protein
MLLGKQLLQDYTNYKDRTKPKDIDSYKLGCFETSVFLTLGHRIPQVPNAIKNTLDTLDYSMIEGQYFLCVRNAIKALLFDIIIRHDFKSLTEQQLLELLQQIGIEKADYMPMLETLKQHQKS